MKGFPFLFVILVATLPACRNPFKACTTRCKSIPQKQAESVQMPTAMPKEDALIFDESAEELVLEGDEMFGDAVSTPATTSGDAFVTQFNEDMEPEIDFDDAPGKEQLAAVIYFPYDQDKPTPGQEENMQKAIVKAQEIVAEGKKVACKGHACEWGERCKVRNIPLSMQRSEKVAEYLAANGNISKNAIKVFGVGSEEPVSFEHSKDGQSPNRRVEIYALAA